MKTLIKVASSPALLEDPKSLEELFHTEGWQTLMTFTREMARKSRFASHHHLKIHTPFAAPSRPQFPASSSGMDEDIPQDVFDQITRAEAEAGGSGASGIRICPHCTFENTGGGSDCDVCGLPL